MNGGEGGRYPDAERLVGIGLFKQNKQNQMMLSQSQREHNDVDVRDVVTIQLAYGLLPHLCSRGRALPLNSDTPDCWTVSDYWVYCDMITVDGFLAFICIPVVNDLKSR